MSMKIIRNQVAWDKFKQEFCKTSDVPPSATWGNGPQIYPCVVNAIYFPLGSRVLCCYFYPDAARELLGVALRGSEPREEIIEDAGLREEVEVLRRHQVDLAKQIRDFAISNNANLRVFIARALDTGLYDSMDWYEKRYAQELAVIDQMVEEKRQSLAPQDLRPPQTPPAKE